MNESTSASGQGVATRMTAFSKILNGLKALNGVAVDSNRDAADLRTRLVGDNPGECDVAQPQKGYATDKLEPSSIVTQIEEEIQCVLLEVQETYDSIRAISKELPPKANPFAGACDSKQPF